MRKVYLSILVFAICNVNCTAQSNKGFWQSFDIASLSVGVAGTKLVKVWGEGSSVNKAMEQAKKNALYACLFLGLPSGNSVNATPALCVDVMAYNNNYDYFKKFFKNKGEYLNYVILKTNIVPSGDDIRHLQGGGYKVAIYVQIMYDNLRKHMEESGIIRSLNYGF